MTEHGPKRSGWNLSAFAIANWQLTGVVFVLVALLGTFALLSIPRSVDPHFPVTVTFVTTVLPGASVNTVEQTVTKPIERALTTLDRVKRIESVTKDGSSFIFAEFDYSGDPDDYFNDVVREVTALRPQLPQGIASLRFRKARTTNAAAFQIALISDTASVRRLEKFARQLSEAFTRHPDVRAADIQGINQPLVEILVNPRRLAELRLPADVVVDALQGASVELPAGNVISDGRSFNVRAGGAFATLDEVRGVPIRTSGASDLTVGNVARVSWSTERERARSFSNGQRAVFVTVTQKSGTDVIRLKDDLEQMLAGQRQLLPPDIDVRVQFDQSIEIARKMRELGRDFVLAIALVMITLLPLGIRPAGIVAVSIPFSLGCGLIGVYLTGSTLNQLVIGAFVLTLGLLVDDSIVVTENIVRHLRMGKSRVQAALDGSREVLPAITGSTAVLVCAFLPLLALPDGPGVFIVSFVLATIFTITASLLVSITVVPFLAGYFLARHEDAKGNRLLQRLNAAIERLYAPLLRQWLARPGRYVIITGIAMVAATAAALPGIGKALFPYADTPNVRVVIEAESGAGLDRTEELVRRASAVLAQEPEIRLQTATAGGDNPQIFYNVFPTGQYVSKGEIIASVDRWQPARHEPMLERIQQKLDRIPGARMTVVRFQNGSPISSPVSIRVIGADLAQLKQLAGQVETILRQTPGARGVYNPLAHDAIDLTLEPVPEKLARLDVPVGAVRRAIRLALAGEPAGLLRDSDGDGYPLAVRTSAAPANPVSSLDEVFVPSRSGALVPLADLTRQRLSTSIPEIAHRNQQRVVQVNAQVVADALPAAVAERAMNRIRAEIPVPAGYQIAIGGEAEEIDNTLNSLGPVVLLSITLIFIILLVEFGQFRDTIVVAAVIPLGLFGGILALWLSGQPFSFLAAIGCIALIGIEIKNSILLVDFTSQLRREGRPLADAIETAGRIRFLPVLLTAVTAIGGLLPLALFGGSLYAPLAWVIIGGLVSSTLLSRLVIPAVYLLIARRSETKSLERTEHVE